MEDREFSDKIYDAMYKMAQQIVVVCDNEYISAKDFTDELFRQVKDMREFVARRRMECDPTHDIPHSIGEYVHMNRNYKELKENLERLRSIQNEQDI